MEIKPVKIVYFENKRLNVRTLDISSVLHIMKTSKYNWQKGKLWICTNLHRAVHSLGNDLPSREHTG